MDKQPSKVQVLPEIITVPDSDEASITESEYSEDTLNTSSIYHQKNLNEYKTQEDIMHEVNIYHKTILDYANHSHKNDEIDNCRYNHHNMIDEDYTGIIKRELPRLHNALNPISKKHIIQELWKMTLNTLPQGWEEFRKTRSREFRTLKKTIVFNQMLKNNFSHAWKQIYKDVNDFCNEY